MSAAHQVANVFPTEGVKINCMLREYGHTRTYSQYPFSIQNLGQSVQSQGEFYLCVAGNMESNSSMQEDN